MSEEEVIKVLKNHAQYTNAKVIDANTRKEYKVSEAIDGLLDLYNKEKEKNKELFLQYEKEVDKLEYQITTMISKDKIRGKIKELEEKIHVVTPDTHIIEKITEFKKEGALNILQELLEEE